MHLSFRNRMIVAFTAAVLLIVFLIFAAGNYYINSLQKSNVQASITLAQEQARQLSRDILTMLANSQRNTDLSAPEVKERINARTEVILELNKNVVWAAVFDSEGNRIVERSTGQEQIVHPQRGTDGTYQAEVPTTDGQRLQMTVVTEHPGTREFTQSIPGRDGKPLGDIRLRVTENPTYKKIETTSHQITHALLAELGLLLALMSVLFYCLWRLFSRQVKLLQKTEKLDRMAYVGTLASGLAHEIRNPLSAMGVNLQVLREELGDPRPDSAVRATDLASRVEREVHQLNGILTSFLDFALPTRESVETFPVRSVIDELAHANEQLMKQSGISYVLESPPAEDTAILADRRLVTQALRNVFVNALQALSNSIKKELRIRIDLPAPDRVRVRFIDSGPGIAAENLPKIFDVFFSTRKGGAGFGLAITRKIIAEHGGTILAENNRETLGATFTIELLRQATLAQSPR